MTTEDVRVTPNHCNSNRDDEGKNQNTYQMILKIPIRSISVKENLTFINMV